MLKLESLRYRYGRSQPDVLNDISVNIEADTVTAILGVSGSGKTTLLNLMSLLWDQSLPKANGRITCQIGSSTYDYAHLRGNAAAQIRREHFGFVLQSSYLVPAITCGANVAFPLALKGVPAPERNQRVAELLRAAGLVALRDRSPREVSGGERQRFAVLRAVVHDPQFLFADEPLSNLDFHSAERIFSLLRSWKSGELHKHSSHPHTLILVTHDINTAWQEATRFVLLRHGRILRGGALTQADLPGGPSEIRRLLDPNSKEE